MIKANRLTLVDQGFVWHRQIRFVNQKDKVDLSALIDGLRPAVHYIQDTVDFFG